jgi:hypothetical protein
MVSEIILIQVLSTADGCYTEDIEVLLLNGTNIVPV